VLRKYVFGEKKFVPARDNDTFTTRYHRIGSPPPPLHHHPFSTVCKLSCIILYYAVMRHINIMYKSYIVQYRILFHLKYSRLVVVWVRVDSGARKHVGPISSFIPPHRRLFTLSATHTKIRTELWDYARSRPAAVV